jgi:hypothetical protein
MKACGYDEFYYKNPVMFHWDFGCWHCRYDLMKALGLSNGNYPNV